MHSTARIFSILLTASLLFTLAACAPAPTETTAQTTEATTQAPTQDTTPTEDPILAERRTTAESYMRSMATVLWRAEESVLYTLSSDTLPEDASASTQLQLEAGRIYQGLPYSYAGSTGASFLEYAGTPDGSGVCTVSGLNWESLSGGGRYSRLGNDCSSAVALAWSQVSSSIAMTSTQYMTEKNGYLRVGDYQSNPSDNTNSAKTCEDNGKDVMYAAYAQLQKADAVVMRGESSGHAMLISDVHVVYTEDGSINGHTSYVKVLEQTRSNFKSQKLYYSDTLQETVYLIYGIDVAYSFQDLMETGYLPITCKELIDPSPVEAPLITDSITAHSKDTILQGTISCNHFIDTVTVTITGLDGAVVQEGALRAVRAKNYYVELERFLTEDPAKIRGQIDPTALRAGEYHCTLVCRLTTGEEFTVRDFDFSV